MMPHFKVAVFDVDGTLLDTTQGVISSVKYTMKVHGLKEPDEKTLKSFIGPPIQNSFARVYNLKGDILQELATTFRDRYKSEDLYKAVPYDGIYEVFEKLIDAGIKPAVATYKRQDYALDILKRFKFDEYTDILYGADHENKLKKKDIIKKCLIDSGADNPKDAVMIGDSDNDAIGAYEIGTNFIGVTYGFGFSNEMDVMKFDNIGIASSPKEILKYIL